MRRRVIFTGRAFFFLYGWIFSHPRTIALMRTTSVFFFFLSAHHGILCLSVPPAGRRHLKREQTSLSETEATPSSACFADGKRKNEGRDGGALQKGWVFFFFNGLNLVAGGVSPQTVDN